jgi:hypothetical protein
MRVVGTLRMKDLMLGDEDRPQFRGIANLNCQSATLLLHAALERLSVIIVK